MNLHSPNKLMKCALDTSPATRAILWALTWRSSVWGYKSALKFIIRFCQASIFLMISSTPWYSTDRLADLCLHHQLWEWRFEMRNWSYSWEEGPREALFGWKSLYGGKTSSAWILRQVGSGHKQFLRIHFARRRDLPYQVSFWALMSAGWSTNGVA